MAFCPVAFCQGADQTHTAVFVTWRCKDISPDVHLQLPGLLQLSFCTASPTTTAVCTKRYRQVNLADGSPWTHLTCSAGNWNCTGCLSDAVSTSNWQHWCLSRYTAAHCRIFQTRASQRLRSVAVSARLAPSHASYRCPELVWATGRLMSPDHGFGTSCLLHCGRLTVCANSEDSWKRIFCQGLGCGAYWLLLLGAGYKYSYLLTYLPWKQG